MLKPRLSGFTNMVQWLTLRGLYETFPPRAISRRGNSEWPATSPDLKVCDFFLWGYLKSKLYEKDRRTTVDLKQNTTDEVAAISHSMLQQVMQKFQKHLQK
jgi:hypothetical protein